MRTWEKDGVGKSSKWQRRIMEDFRQGGTQSIGETAALQNYLNGLSTDILQEMYEYDSEVLLEMLVNCFGTKKSFEIYMDIMDNCNIDYEKEFYKAAEALNKANNTIKELNETADKALEDRNIAQEQSRKDSREKEEKALELEDVKKKAQELKEELERLQKYHHEKNQEEVLLRTDIHIRNNSYLGRIEKLENENKELKAEIYDMRKEKKNEGKTVTVHLQGYSRGNCENVLSAVCKGCMDKIPGFINNTRI